MYGRMESSALCRVCLASDRAMHRVADTPLEETYERVTRETLVVEGLPCCVCGVCLSALRRCRRFIDTAHQANIALDRWSRSRSPRAKIKLTETPLLSLTRTVTEVVDHMPLCQQPPIKQEIDDAANVDNQMLQQEQYDSIPDDEDNIFTEEIKYEVTDLDDDEYIHDSDDECTHGSDDENDNTQIYDNAGSDKTHSTDDDNSNVECVNKYDNEIDWDEKTEMLEDAKVLDNVGDETAPDTSNVGRDYMSSDDDMPLRSLRSRKNIKKMSPCNKRGESWSQDDLKAALIAVKKGKFSQRAIALKYKIPRRTLRDHVKTGQDVKRMGRRPLLTVTQENDLCSRIENFAEIGVPLTPKFIRKQAFMFCETFGIKHNFDTTKRIAGAEWLRKFLKRNPVINYESSTWTKT